MTYNSRELSVVDFIDIADKELHRQVGYHGILLTSGSLGVVMVSTLARNARDVGSIPALGTIFTIFITPESIHS